MVYAGFGVRIMYWSCVFVLYVFFFFKQKTAYEMRISDWSSDVCSSDPGALGQHRQARGPGGVVGPSGQVGIGGEGQAAVAVTGCQLPRPTRDRKSVV